MIFLDLPIVVLLLVYFCLNAALRIHDLYLVPQIETLKWTSDRARKEQTYYSRYCDEDDFSAFEPGPLFLDKETSTAQDAHDTFLEHGYVFFPEVLSRATASRMRDFALWKNKKTNPDPNGGNNGLHSAYRRWLIDLGTSDDPIVAEVLQEVATNPLFHESIEKILGPNPALVEMDVITSAAGADYQALHSDGIGRMSPLSAARSFSPTHVFLMQLQDTPVEMGPTQVCPGTHYCMEGPFWADCGKSHIFSVVNETGYWPIGGAVLMNTNSVHRGGAYEKVEDVEEQPPHRVMLVLTFAPHPEPRAESRMLTHGLSYSLPWYMLGHTLHDMVHAQSIMQRPWTYLRALGIFKRWDSPVWGVDYVTLCMRRFANEYVFDNAESLRKYLDEDDSAWIFKFLHGGYPQSETWHEFMLDSVRLAKDLACRCIVAVVCVYLVVLATMVGSIPTGGNDSARALSRMAQAALRLGLVYLCCFKLFDSVNNKIDCSSWATDIVKGRRNFAFYQPDKGNPLEKGPTTMPSKFDVLIETRFGSEYLAMYNDFVSFHPANKEWRRLVADQAHAFSTFIGYGGGLSASFRRAIAQNIVGELQMERQSRFLYQNHGTGAWHVMSKENAVAQTILELSKASSPLLASLLQSMRFLDSDCRHGFRRSTSLCQNYARPLLASLQTKLLSNASTDDSPKKGMKTSIQESAMPPNPLVRRLSTLTRVSAAGDSSQSHLQSRRTAFPVLEEMSPLQYLPTSGDHVLAWWKEEMFDGWVEYVLPHGEVLVHFRDGDEFLVYHGDVMQFSTLHPGMEFQMKEGDKWWSVQVSDVDLESATLSYVYAGTDDVGILSFAELWRFRFPVPDALESRDENAAEID